MRTLLMAVIGVFLGAVPPEVEAQTFAVVGGSPSTNVSGADVTINVGVVSGTHLLRIYDPSFTGLPDDDVGKITIQGSLDPSTPSELLILVAGPNDSWNNNVDFALTETGLRRMGLNPGDGIEILDADLRKRTRFSGFVSDEINGEVSVGQIHRVQCGPVGSLPMGTISANITAIALNEEFGPGGITIGYIRAGNGITGTITASGSPSTFVANDPDTHASIYRIVVGPSTDPGVLGIQGDILAPSGSIESIFTMGPIGSPGNLKKLWAANRIREVRTAPDVGFPTGSVVAVDAHIDLQANRVLSANRNTFLYQGPPADGTLTLIEVGGDLYGEIKCANIDCPNPGGAPSAIPISNCRKRGIYVRGICYAPITVDYNAMWTNIVARTFMEPITIGRFLKGTVVATGQATPPSPTNPAFIDGHIPDLKIGRGPLPPGTSLSVYLDHGPGLCGIDGSQFVPSTIDDWFIFNGPDSGAIDGMIHASNSIGNADIASLSLRFYTGCKSIPPRIQSPHIDSLILDDLRLGVVWSGSHTDPYSQIDHAEIGCVGYDAAAWIKDWNTASFETVLGTIHAPTVPFGKSLQIARYLGDNDDTVHQPGGAFDQASCECVHWTCSTDCTFSSSFSHTDPEVDPNYPYCSTDSYNGGRIWLAHDLQGHIILNADASAHTPASDYWTGRVTIGYDNIDPACPSETFSQAETQPYQAPLYNELSGNFNGGTIGLPPFHLKRNETDPPSTCTTLPCFILSGTNDMPVVPALTFEGVGIKLPFYGPVKANVATGRPIVHMYKGDGMGHIIPSPDYGPDLSYNIVGEELYLFPNPALPPGTFSPGRYIIKHYANDLGLLCDDLTTTANVPVAEFVYHFILGTRPGIGVDAGCGDFDGDNDAGTDADIEAFFACLAGNCCSTCGSADVNCDGDTGTDADIEAFFLILAGMACPDACDP